MRQGFRLGSGVHGTVYATDDVRYACKVVDLVDGELPPSILREMSAIHCLAQSRSVIDCIQVTIDKKSVRLILPRYQCDLYQWMRRQSKIHCDQIRSIVYQILQGLRDANGVFIAHRDLKPANILINEPNLTVTIADWGLSRLMPTEDPAYFTNPVQAIGYRSPELLLGHEQYDRQIDLWSVGVIMAELSRGKPLFSGDTEQDVLRQIFHTLKSLRSVIPHLDDDAFNLLTALLQIDPLDRIKVDQALNHYYFDSLRSTEWMPLTPDGRIYIDSHYLQWQPQITPSMRVSTLKHLLHLKHKMNLGHSTYFMAVDYLDLYLSRGVIPASQLHPLGLACLSLSIKINEIQEFSIQSSRITPSDLASMMVNVTQELDYNLYRLNVYSYWYLLSQQLEIDQSTRQRSLEWCYSVIMDLNSRQYQPDQLASTILLHCDPSLPIDERFDCLKVYVETLLES